MMKLEIETIMRRAWKLAKSGAKRFGGSAREYLAAAIRMSWALWKKENRAVRPVTYSLPVAEVAVDQAEGVAAVATAEVISAQASKASGFFSKIKATAQKAITGIKNFFTGAVTIELVGAHG